jgi:hypothetical protein
MLIGTCRHRGRTKHTSPVGDTRTVIAAAKLYQLSGSTEVLLGGEAKTLNVGEGLFIGGRRRDFRRLIM